MVTAGKMICSMGIWSTEVDVGPSPQSLLTRNAVKKVKMNPRATTRNHVVLKTPLHLENARFIR